jgi:hypothetical protein
MYTNFVSYDTTNYETIDSLIKHDINDFKRSSQEVIIQKSNDLKIPENTAMAQVYYFFGGSSKNYEAVAYIAAPTGVGMIVITSRNKKGLNNNLKKFEELVKSYSWLTDKYPSTIVHPFF